MALLVSMLVSAKGTPDTGAHDTLVEADTLQQP